MPSSTLEDIRKAGWELPREVLDTLGGYQREFLMAQLTGTRTPGYYAARLAALGLAGLGRVVDAACGTGQWTVALAGLNGQAEGVDIDAGRLLVARELAGAMGAANCAFRHGRLEALPFADASVDGLFCRGAFMFSDTARTLAEFRRVLRPGGRAYLDANGPGWTAHMFWTRGLRARDWNQAASAVMTTLRTALGRPARIFLTAGRLRALARANGLTVLGCGPEGSLSCPPGRRDSVPPIYPERMFGLPAVHELLLRKDGP